jgi:conjugative transfer region protein (TIGR03748 family)
VVWEGGERKLAPYPIEVESGRFWFLVARPVDAQQHHAIFIMRTFAMRLVSLHLLVSLCLSLPVVSSAQEPVQTGRYTTVATWPTEAQKNPLSEIVIVRFPETVTTVGDAMRNVLSRTGYALRDATNVEVVGLLGRPLPEIQRMLGPMAISVALETLAGPAFRMNIDAVHRLVEFELDPKGQTIDSADAEGEGA